MGLTMIRLTALWCKEFIALSRDRHGLLALFLMPAIFVLVMSLALRDSFTPGASNHLHYAVLDADRSIESKGLADRLERAGVITQDKTVPTGRAKLRDAVREGSLAFVLVIPKNFGATLMDERNPDARPLLCCTQHSGNRCRAHWAVCRHTLLLSVPVR
jgi:ABC-2 type transport system permease protein